MTHLRAPATALTPIPSSVGQGAGAGRAPELRPAPSSSIDADTVHHPMVQGATDWRESAYLECCRQRVRELREHGRCITPLIEPDNSHCDPVVARNTHSKGKESSRDRLYEREPARRTGAIRVAGWAGLECR